MKSIQQLQDTPKLCGKPSPPLFILTETTLPKRTGYRRTTRPGGNARGNKKRFFWMSYIGIFLVFTLYFGWRVEQRIQSSIMTHLSSSSSSSSISFLQRNVPFWNSGSNSNKKNYHAQNNGDKGFYSHDYYRHPERFLHLVVANPVNTTTAFSNTTILQQHRHHHDHHQPQHSKNTSSDHPFRHSPLRQFVCLRQELDEKNQQQWLQTIENSQDYYPNHPIVGGILLFLHLPKTGGTTIRMNLQQLQQEQNHQPYPKRRRQRYQSHQQQQKNINYTRIMDFVSPSGITATTDLMDRLLPPLPASRRVTPETTQQHDGHGHGQPLQLDPNSFHWSPQSSSNIQNRRHSHDPPPSSSSSARPLWTVLEFHGDIPGLFTFHSYIQEWKKRSEWHRIPLLTFTLVREPQALQVSYFRHFHRPNCTNPWCEEKLYNLTQTNLVQSVVPNRQCDFLQNGQREVKKQQQRRRRPEDSIPPAPFAATSTASSVLFNHSGGNSDTPAVESTIGGNNPKSSCHLEQIQQLLWSDWDWVGITHEINTVTLPLLFELLFSVPTTTTTTYYDHGNNRRTTTSDHHMDERNNDPATQTKHTHVPTTKRFRQHTNNNARRKPTRRKTTPPMKMMMMMKKYNERNTPWGELHPSQWSIQTQMALQNATKIDQLLWTWVQETYPPDVPSSVLMARPDCGQ